MGHSVHELLDDRALVQVLCNKVRGGPDELDTGIVRLAIRIRTLETWEKPMMYVDDRAVGAIPAEEVRREDLHVAGENKEIRGVVTADLLNFSLHGFMGSIPAGDVVIRDVQSTQGAVQRGGSVGPVVVADHEGDRHGEIAVLASDQQLVHAMLPARQEDAHPRWARLSHDVLARSGVLAALRLLPKPVEEHVPPPRVQEARLGAELGHNLRNLQLEGVQVVRRSRSTAAGVSRLNRLPGEAAQEGVAPALLALLDM